MSALAARLARYRDLPFRIKLQIMVVSLTVILLGGALIGVERAVQGAAHEKIEGDFKRSLSTLGKVLEYRLGSMEEATAAALADPIFRSQVGKSRQLADDLGLGPLDGARPDRALRESHDVFASADLPLFRNYPVLVVVNVEGVLVFTKADRKAFGGEIGELDAVKRTLKEGRAVAIWSGKDLRLLRAGVLPLTTGSARAAAAQAAPTGSDDLYLVLGQVITSGNATVGAVLAAEKIADTVLPQLEESSHSQVILASPSDDLIMSGGLRPFAAELYKEALLAKRGRGADEPQTVYTTRLQGQAHLALAAALRSPFDGEVIGGVSLFRSLNDEMDVFQSRMRLAMLIVLLLAIVLSVAATSVFSERLTQPLLSLEQGVRKVQAGDLTVSVPVSSGDEVGTLTRTFNRMIVSLREKTDLERLNAKLRSELHHAREIQRSLLPPATQRFGAVSMETLYHPCEDLSGDFYDSIQRGDWLYFYLADVTSHGTAAAQVTYLLKELFHQTVLGERTGENGLVGEITAPGAAPTLPQLIPLIQDRYASYKLGYDVAIQVARLNLKDLSLEYVRANAPSALRVSRGQARSLECVPAPALSANHPGSSVRDMIAPATATLLPGDSLFLFTDGCYEFESDGGKFGRKELYLILAGADGEGWREAVFERLKEANRGDRFDDDLSIIRVSVKG